MEKLAPTLRYYIHQYIQIVYLYDALICMKPVITEANPAGNYKFKVNNRNTRTRYEICSKLTIKIPERRRRRSGISIVNFEHISHLALLFLLLTLSR